MEKAVFITKLSQLKYVDGRYRRLYFGNEFCERLIPSADIIRKILAYVKTKGMNFSLVTPYVTDSGLKKLEMLFELLKTMRIDCEVIINDWGVLNLINHEYSSLQPVLGRLLTKQKRGPRLFKLLKREVRPKLIKNKENPRESFVVIQKKMPLDLDPYYKGSNTSSVPIIQEFLNKERIKRIELDNLLQGMHLELYPNRVSVSVYFPFAYITTTFFCPTRGCEEKEKSFIKIGPCRKECQRYTFKLRHSTMPKVIYLKGNAKFYKNSKVPIRKLEKIGVNRIVYQPEIPI